VQAHPIVVALDKLLEVLLQLFQIAIFTGIDLLPLQRLHEAFATRIVIRIGWPAHAGNNFMLLQQLNIFLRRILHSAIGMMDQTASRLSCGERPLQCCLG